MIVQITTPRMELWRIDGPFSNVPHFHEEDFQITVPIYGTCDFIQENRNYRLADGSGLVQHPNERHVFEIGEQSGVVIFKVRQAGLETFARSESLELDLRQQFDRTKLAGQFHQWVSALMTGDPNNRMAQDETEEQVFSYLCGALSGSHTSSSRAAAQAHIAAFGMDAYMSQVLEFMHAHYTDAITIEELASIAKQSRFHFIRSFKSSFGVTPYQYVLRLRIDEAKRLLTISDRSITDIAMRLGFSSGSAFYRAFVKSVGVTPEHYRMDRRV
ncbi:AraC-like DNA-binding protein [Paenibacillus cellulosilyticus]|uniref:AraC-like DNA-binding protein n=1 Tax=Paenibacillus cellulosilyticus TaxID=375489 RepID=A0A2V2YQF8_9BACL|nr:AraC family transcriptional regulator [Paenibacillus cellulosilyticus]PWV95885.1 AraC-like DNA-binding protein [Paenibacillus cellulosilyticus]QKS47754.1 helix-turn-helix transcriptional regulator [Paenibacillus cellulosilyticus]